VRVNSSAVDVVLSYCSSPPPPLSRAVGRGPWAVGRAENDGRRKRRPCPREPWTHPRCFSIIILRNKYAVEEDEEEGKALGLAREGMEEALVRLKASVATAGW